MTEEARRDSRASADDSRLGTPEDGNGVAPPSIESLVRAHHEVLYRYAFRLSGSAADAEDLTQQTFLIAQQKLHQLRQWDRARPWLYSVLRSCFLKNVRKSAPAAATTVDLQVESIPAEMPAESPVDGEQLQAALNQLPEDFRLILSMFYFEDASYKEIADQLELKIGTVMSRLSRAKDRLRRLLFDETAAASPPAGDKKMPVSGRPAR
jgi:RNA polymerase sigma-70 factor, ECF subfamily